MCRTGWFATLWKEMAERLSLNPVFVDTDWRRGADVPGLAAALAADTAHKIKAVCVVHNETSTGCASRVDEVRSAMDAEKHPALLMVDTISSRRLDRLPARRVGRRCDGRGFAKRSDAASGAVVQRDQRQGAEGHGDGETPAQLLGLAADAGGQQRRVFSLHTRNQFAVRPERSGEDAAGRRAGECVRPPRPFR